MGGEFRRGMGKEKVSNKSHPCLGSFYNEEGKC